MKNTVYVVYEMTRDRRDFLGLCGVFWTEAEAKQWIATTEMIHKTKWGSDSMSEYDVDETEIGGVS